MAKQMNRGERFVFNETHLQKNYEIKLKKERTSEQCPEFVKKNPKRPILRGKIVLMTLFSKIALCNRSFLHYIKDTHMLKAQKVTGYEAIQLSGLCKHIICNSFHLTITDDEYYKYF